MTKYFAQKPNAVKTGIISGNMKQQSILETVSQFERGELDVLLSTTIVEVGGWEVLRRNEKKYYWRKFAILSASSQGRQAAGGKDSLDFISFGAG